MDNWKLVDNAGGLRMERLALRAMGEDRFTWAHLLYGRLGHVRVGIFYFPSRFNTDTDTAVVKALTAFGANTGPGTSVNFWDTTDPALDHALELFSLKTVPAVVLATGLQIAGIQPRGPDKTPLYSITLSRPSMLSNPSEFQEAINTAHEILTRCDPNEISSYIRAQKADSILAVIGNLAAHLRDAILKLKPKFELPGGVSVQLGG